MKWKLVLLACLTSLTASATAEIPKAKLDRLIADLVSTLSYGRQSSGCGTYRTAGDLAADALVKIGRPAVPRLIRALGSDIFWVRALAAEALGRIKDPAALGPLMEMAQAGHKSESDRAIVSIGSIGGPGTFEFLAGFVAAGPGDDGQAAALALGSLNDERAVPILMEIVGRQGSGEELEAFKFSARRGLIALGRLALPALVVATKAPGKINPEVLHALSSMRLDEALAALRSVSVRPDSRAEAMEAILSSRQVTDEDICTALCDTDPEIVAAGIESASYRTSPRLAEAALNLFKRLAEQAGDTKTEPEKELLSAAASLATQMNGDRMAPMLLQQLRQAQGDDQAVYIGCLSEIHAPAAVSEFVRYLKAHPAAKSECCDGEEWQVGIHGLGRAGRPGLAALRKLWSERSVTAEQVAATLGVVDDRSAAGDVAAWARDKDVSIRRAAASALEDLGEPSMIPLLATLLEDEDPTVRSYAAGALVEAKDVRGVGPILRSAARRQVGSYMALRLGRFGRLAVPECLASMRSPSALERAFALQVMGYIADTTTFPTMRKALREIDPFVKTSAVKALAKASDVEALPTLLDELDRGNRDYKIAVYDAIVELESKARSAK